jgi:hypothetical protein
MQSMGTLPGLVLMQYHLVAGQAFFISSSRSKSSVSFANLARSFVCCSRVLISPSANQYGRRMVVVCARTFLVSTDQTLEDNKIVDTNGIEIIPVSTIKQAWCIATGLPPWGEKEGIVI